MADTKSIKYIKALQGLPQFRPAYTPVIRDIPYAIHVLTGVHVYPLDPDSENSGLLLLKFSESCSVEVFGHMYLDLQIEEAARHYLHAPSSIEAGPVEKLASELQMRIFAEYNLID